MKRNSRLELRSAAAAALLSLVAAASPAVLAQAGGGLWEIQKSGAAPVRLCLPNPMVLAQFENRESRCTREVIRDTRSMATVHYSCAGGDFGQSDVTVLTPRSLRVETQGISRNSPFKYVFQARRVGDCPAH